MPQQTAEEFYGMSAGLSPSELNGIARRTAIPRAYHDVRHPADVAKAPQRQIVRGRPRRLDADRVTLGVTVGSKYAGVIDAWALRYHTNRSGALELMIEALVQCDGRIADESL